MSADWYTLLSLGMRYWFAILAAVIVYRAWRATIRDNRRARVLRSWAPDTGAIGEIVVIGGGGGVRKGSRVPIPKEGLLGSARRADVRLKHADVRRYHAHIEQRENGVLMETLNGAEIWLAGRTGEKLLLRDGDRFMIGSLSLLLVLYEPGAASAGGADEEEEDELFSPASANIAATKPKRASKTVRPKASKPARRTLTENELFPPFAEGFEKDFEARADERRAARKDENADEVEWWPDERR